ncbi:MAG TPA: DUF488 domain-containing protein [Verrucomicrobiota bacterium]|nr:DUF488 domain-containing protein [Verrucomicrobiota bacterium]HRT07933.1 DUF488 domain-containing protein [Candidatus Paceibacterota bacterium]
MASLGPSEALLRAGQAHSIPWSEFRRRYLKELRDSRMFDRRNPTIKNHGQKWTLRLLQTLARRGTVTLMCHCPEDQTYCHRHILKEILEGKI